MVCLVRTQVTSHGTESLTASYIVTIFSSAYCDYFSIPLGFIEGKVYLPVRASIPTKIDQHPMKDMPRNDSAS